MRIKRYDQVRWPGALTKKIRALAAWFENQGSLLVAYSGGVDSTLLVALAGQILGRRVLAVTADSPSLQRAELKSARQLARALRLRHRVIRTCEMDNPVFTANPPDRCYHCKSELFARLNRMAQEAGLSCVADGSNLDDRADYRPGSKAALEQGVQHPFQEFGFTKKDIRQASRLLGLPTADKPAMACLASRLPYGTPITREALATIERAEAALQRFGFKQCRVRLHGGAARIELPPAELSRALRKRLAIVRALKNKGLRYIALDLEGYRTGSLNEALNS